MDRRSFFSKIPFLGAAAVAVAMAEPPQPETSYVLTLAAPQCPKCLMAFDCSIKTDEQARFLNWDPKTQTIIVEHPRLRPEYAALDCLHAGVKLRFKLPRVTAEVIR